MGFEKFSQFGRKDSSFISITTSKSFGFGGDFLRSNNLTQKKSVELFFDKDEMKIGFKFYDDKQDGAFTLSDSHATESKSVVARSFFTSYSQYIKIEDFKNRYIPKKISDDEFGELFTITLEKK